MEFAVKYLVEIVISLLVHPLSVVLAWINLAQRDDLDGTKKTPLGGHLPDLGGWPDPLPAPG